jgi:hypothetical protein
VRPDNVDGPGARGAAGPRGPTGPPGRAGEAEIDATVVRVIEQLVAGLEDVQGQLKIQFTRIAQLQAQLDHVRAALVKARPEGRVVGRAPTRDQRVRVTLQGAAHRRIFSEAEKVALEYADAIKDTRRDVDDELFARMHVTPTTTGEVTALTSCGLVHAVMDEGPMGGPGRAE